MDINKEIDLSEKERLFFVGDIHGHLDELLYALGCLDFSDNDVLVSVGDVIDRGPRSLESLLFMKHKENVFMVRGNHEDFFTKGFLKGDANAKAMCYWNGGEWTDDYHRCILKGLAEWCDTLPYSLTIKFKETVFGVCHAESAEEKWQDNFSSEGMDIEEKKTLMLWGRDRIDEPEIHIKGVDYTIHGHMVIEKPLMKGNQLWIDTGCQGLLYNKDSSLTIVEFKDGAFEEHRFGHDLFKELRDEL